MRFKMLLAALPLLAACQTLPQAPAPSAAPPAVSVEAMRRHIDVLASDAFEGRKPGTAGETKTINYMTRQLAEAGFEPGGIDGTWLQPVPLMERRPISHEASFTAGSRKLPFDSDNLVLIGRAADLSAAAAPVMVLGPNAAMEGVSGAVILLPYSPNLQERSKALADAGAAAVITVLPAEAPWGSAKPYLQQSQTAIDRGGARISGAMPLSAARALVAASGGDLTKLLDGQAPGRTGITANLSVRSDVRAYASNNVLGRLRGTGGGTESVLYLGHWDHLGVCAPEASDKICNGAVDNASGIAMLLEVARALASGPRLARDILVMGTTAEESGLLGAHYFAEHPTVPLKSIVAAINVDTVAIHHAGEPVAVIGRGIAPLDALIDETAGELGRRMDTDTDADAFVQRQDGYALAAAGVPAIMIGGSFSNMSALNAFLGGPYHKPNDDLNREIILDGAAEDTALLIALGRKLADPARYARP